MSFVTLLAAAGVGIAFVPGVPTLALHPDAALALFIARRAPPRLCRGGLPSGT